MIYLIIATICFSLSFGLIKANLTGLPSEFVVLFRLLIASLIFLPFTKYFKKKKNVLAMAIGAIQFGGMYLCFIKAFQYLQGNEIAILTTTTPIFVGLWSILFGEKFRWMYLLCIALSVVGAVIIVWQNVELDILVKGVVLMETTNCLFALGQVLWKKFVSDNSAKYMFSAYFGATLFVLPFALFNVNFSELKIGLPQILSILYLSIIPTGIGFWLWNKGAIQVEYITLAVMNNLKIPLGILFSILIFKETINPLNFCIGLIFIVLSALLSLPKKIDKDNKLAQ